MDRAYVGLRVFLALISPLALALTSLDVLFFAATATAQTDTGSCSGGGADVASLQLKIKTGLTTIQSLGFGQKAVDMDAWTKLAGEARTKLMSDTLDMLLASAGAGAAAGGSLSPPSANSAISELRAAHIDFAPLNNIIRKVAATPGKPARANEVREFLGAVQRAKDSSQLANKDVNRESALEALSKVLGWFETDPRLALLAADLQFTTSAIYDDAASRVSRDQIDKLTTLTEKDLQSLKRLSDQLAADVRARNALLACMARSKTPSESNYLARKKGLRACTDQMMASHHACGDNPPFSGPAWDAWNRCMDAANAAYDSCVSALPPVN
jgi:hypothetical protein